MFRSHRVRSGWIQSGSTGCFETTHINHWLPLFARGAVPLTARGRIIEESTNEQIEIGGVTVRPGDYVIADNSGIVVVPGDRAEEVIPEAESIVARETAMARDVMDGKSVTEVMGINYEQMLAR